MILYSFRRCPYAMRARMALLKAGLQPELREVVLRDKPAELLKASPKGTVPVLVKDNGAILEESLDIMRWALEQNDPGGWLQADKAKTEALIAQNDGPFKAALDRYKYPVRYPDEDCSDAADDCAAILYDLDQTLRKQDYLLAGHPTLVDIALFPFIRQCAHVDRDWFAALGLPHLSRWLTGHLESALFQTAMIKYAPWQQGSAPVILGQQPR